MGAEGKNPPSSDLQQLEVELLRGVHAAQQAHRAASAEYKRVLGEYGHLLNHPDGVHALRQAAAKEQVALEKYHRALKIFTDLVVHGKRPPSV